MLPSKLLPKEGHQCGDTWKPWPEIACSSCLHGVPLPEEIAKLKQAEPDTRNIRRIADGLRRMRDGDRSGPSAQHMLEWAEQEIPEGKQAEPPSQPEHVHSELCGTKTGRQCTCNPKIIVAESPSQAGTPEFYPETFCPKCNLSSKYNMVAPIGKTIDGRTIWKHFGGSNASCGYEWISPDRIEPISQATKEAQASTQPPCHFCGHKAHSPGHCGYSVGAMDTGCECNVVESISQATKEEWARRIAETYDIRDRFTGELATVDVLALMTNESPSQASKL